MKIGIIFDLDGTLLDTLADLADATNYALQQFGYPPRSLDHVRSVIGNGALQLIRLSMPEDTEQDPQEVLQVFKAYYQTHCDVKTAPYPGIPDALAVLGQKYPLGIVTNKPHSAAAALCAAHFPGICTLGEQAGIPRKPAPDMVRRAMAELRVDACVYVGDSEVDVRTAQNTGVPCLSVLWGLRSRAQLIDAGAVHFCEKAEDLPAAIEMILKRFFPWQMNFTP